MYSEVVKGTWGMLKEAGYLGWMGEGDEVTRAWAQVTAPSEWGVTRMT